MHLEVILKPCPWCDKTPSLWMLTDRETWCWHIQCDNPECKMRPKSPYVAIRKTSKTDYFRLIDKVNELANKWNIGNPRTALDKKVIDLTPIWKNFRYRPY